MTAIEDRPNLPYNRRLERLLDQHPPFLFDACAITTIHNELGYLPLPPTLGRRFIVPEAVAQEIERQRDHKRRSDTGRRLVSHKITNELYVCCGKNILKRTPVDVTPEEYTHMQAALKLASPTQNYRLGQGDAALIVLAHQLAAEKPVIVTCDSDIPYTLAGLGRRNIRAFSPTEYLIAARYSERRRK